LAKINGSEFAHPVNETKTGYFLDFDWINPSLKQKVQENLPFADD
jgi:hypothetical protein